MADVPLTIVGAGVVGLAVAARLAPRFPALLIRERHERPGTGASSRNSEVIHAGIYYPEGSWKARLCVQGNRMLYERCRRHGIPHRRLGKLIVAASPDELPALELLLARRRANGGELSMGGRGGRPSSPARSSSPSSAATPTIASWSARPRARSR